MKANTNCSMIGPMLVFLNGKNIVEHGLCLGANEETGEVLMNYRNARGSLVHEYDAEYGALIVDGLQVIRLKGVVKIQADPTAAAAFGEQTLFDEWTNSYAPLTVMRKVRAVHTACGLANCPHEYWQLEPAFEF